MLGVSRATAQRAMKVLGDAQTLMRRRSLGTFVGPGAVNPAVSRVSTVYILAPDRVHNTIQTMAGWMLDGLRREGGCTNVNFGFVPHKDGLAYVKQIDSVGEGEHASSSVFIAVGCPSEVYRLLAESNVPTLVFGSLYQDAPVLASIDFDNREAARLMTRYLVDRGHKRMMLVATSDGLPGDHEFVDGVSDVLTEVGLPANALAMRIVPDDPKSALQAVRQLLRDDNRPSSLIVRDLPVIETVDRVLSDTGTEIARRSGNRLSRRRGGRQKESAASAYRAAMRNGRDRPRAGPHVEAADRRAGSEEGKGGHSRHAANRMATRLVHVTWHRGKRLSRMRVDAP